MKFSPHRPTPERWQVYLEERAGRYVSSRWAGVQVVAGVASVRYAANRQGWQTKQRRITRGELKSRYDNADVLSFSFTQHV